MIFNETRVIHARLVFHKPSGSRIEIFCLEPVAPVSDVQLAFQQTGHCTWKCLVGNAKRWKTGKLTLTAEVAGRETVLSAEMKEKSRDSFLVEFSWTPGETVFSDILETFGKIPLPPYIGREAIESDNVTYQTVYARNDGSVAAPTAGLHFTPAVFEALSAKDIVRQNITLHVGAGTFKPVSADSLADHVMHSEQVIIPVPVIKNILQYKARHITVVGTTTVRSLESLYWQGVKWLRGEIVSPYLKVDQWDPYKPEYRGISLEESLRKVLDVLDKHGLYELKGYTSLLIAPGYKYQIPDAIVTNFHQPKSTLLLLVSAFIGDDWKKAYDYALGHDFRFLSYGDSCLFYPKT
jgi:S-adenosylmethionine:tRNA ribosyltransferase-isomerase